MKALLAGMALALAATSIAHATPIAVHGSNASPDVEYVATGSQHRVVAYPKQFRRAAVVVPSVSVDNYARDYQVTGGAGRSGSVSRESVATNVPEPATLGLLGLGMAALGFGLRRRRA